MTLEYPYHKQPIGLLEDGQNLIGFTSIVSMKEDGTVLFTPTEYVDVSEAVPKHVQVRAERDVRCRVDRNLLCEVKFGKVYVEGYEEEDLTNLYLRRIHAYLTES